MYPIRSERISELTPDRDPSGNVVYWMSREQRVLDNPGLLFAINQANSRNVRLSVVFTLTDNFPGAYLRHYDFMLKGLEKVAARLKQLNIPFVILLGNPPETLADYTKKFNSSDIILDFDPLKVKQAWINKLISGSEYSLREVDGHNIVPARFVSQKTEFGAYTLRPKIHKNFEYFLQDFPAPKSLSPANYEKQSAFPSWYTEGIPESQIRKLKIDRSVKPVDWIQPGEENGLKAMRGFMEENLAGYVEKRNDPLLDHTSRLSPYLHFGQLYSGRIAIEITKNAPSDDSSNAFLEELVVRKELSDNFCLYNENYDNADGFHSWAKNSHDIHRDDKREYIYSKKEFEDAQTHDPLWNAAQLQMVKSGRMHGYMRMYWAKKILEWTKDAAEAMKIAIYLNDKYELDGRDPNGYAGIAWSIGGVHDRAWKEREVFGKIRYMNYNGCKRKFDVKKYILRYGS